MALNKNEAKTEAPKATEAHEPASSVAKGKRTAANAQVVKQGQEIIAGMTEEQRAVLGSKSGTLHFVRLLGLASQKSLRKVAPDKNEPVSTPVGIVLVSDEDIEVPVIDILKDKTTGIEADDISYRTVKKGEEFNLSYYEFMYLILRPEYSGTLEANGDAQGAYFSPKLPAFMDSKAKLPTPTINLKNGSVKRDVLDIDVKGPDDKYTIKPEFADKYGALLQKKAPKRASGEKNTVPAPTAVSVALSQILGLHK